MMNLEARIALINAQTAMFNAEVESMKAANTYRTNNGMTVAYGESEWRDFIDSWDHIIGHNAVIDYLQVEI